MERLVFAGIDVGGSRNTHLWLAFKNGVSLSFERVNFSGGIEGMVSSLLSYHVVSCAIDAPLSYDIASETGDRSSDRKLRRLLEEKGINPNIVMPLNSMMAVPLRGQVISKVLRGFVGALIETHPTASLRLMGIEDDYKGREIGRELLQRFKRKAESLSGLEVRGLDEVKSDGDLDAAVCSLTAFLFTEDCSKLKRLTDYSNHEIGYAPFYVIGG